MAAEPAADADFAAFLIVRKNRDSCIHWLLTYCQAIEREWSDAELRRRRLASLRRCLASLAEHAHADCRELAPLAPRMLHSTDFDERHFLNLVLPIERRHSRGLRDDELHGADFPPAQGGARDVCDHLRSAFNVGEAANSCEKLCFVPGSIFRTAECLGISRLVLCGYTATPDDAQAARTSMGTHHWRSVKRRRAETAIDELRAAGVPVVAVETVAGAPYAHEFAFPPPPAGCALLLGNERRGAGVGPGRLFPEARPRARAARALRRGCLKNSLNVAVALGMCAHEAARQWAVGGKEAAGDAVGK
ncbi:hypothetical protein EMIHUDRAFT_209193 [Emiliania huxleyi CCMP1516]|uniref:tRNA/rRNA methyltransferase SpoU type domain-containing protein n=2 Tax=Emiliania huxleyi TaxID=2903 RepID=A0A0D3J7U2_EMIH1|nr:hypothetical protein EMIHUDRAFT_209193 [Emiliania huxleyi CCMP1516]EOD19577.1 hypothetical protein EMIHUDRAFT_209193 [Emiliania huxleyi CCMP1516]|eukprot:XP_005772006.1 hypothetical protein EMIHUDRAFT_209193 [Emiliania huxleyi CCMP1516]